VQSVVRFLSEFANEVVGLPVKKGTGKRPERKMQNVHTNIYTLDIFFHAGKGREHEHKRSKRRR
jgi:hypothetical protein